MIKKKINIYLLITFFHIILFAYLNNELLNFFFQRYESISFLIKVTISLLVIIFLSIIIKKNTYLIKSSNFDKLDKIFITFIILFSLNYFISFYFDSKITNYKNIYFLVIFLLVFLILRSVSISITKLNKKIIFLFCIWLLLLLGISYNFFRSDIFHTSSNPVALVFYIVYIWILANEKKFVIKIYYFIIFLCIFLLLKSKFFLAFSIFALIFSFKKFRNFNVKKIFFLFITFYFLLNIISPIFIKKKISETKILNQNFISLIFICYQVKQYNERNDTFIKTQFDEKTFEYCLNLNQNSKFLLYFVNNFEYFDSLLLFQSFGYRYLHIVEVYNYSIKNYFLPSFSSYLNVLKLSNSSNLAYSTPHNSFATILIRLGLPGLIFLFYFFYKIISYRGPKSNSYYKYNLLILLGYFSLNDQLFFHNLIASLFFWFFCTQIVNKNNIKYV
jgi:hypothetical protein